MILGSKTFSRRAMSLPGLVGGFRGGVMLISSCTSLLSLFLSLFLSIFRFLSLSLSLSLLFSFSFSNSFSLLSLSLSISARSGLEQILVQTVNGLISVRTDRQLQALQTEELRLLQQSDESRFKGFQVSAVAVCFYGCFSGCFPGCASQLMDKH